MFTYLLLVSLLSSTLSSPLDNVFRPDEQLGDLFADVQLHPVFPDSKTFVDCLPKFPPETIVQSYNTQKKQSGFNLTSFVLANFDLPPKPANGSVTPNATVTQHIIELWPILTRHPNTTTGLTSLIPLPNDYIVPGGRFGEVYYWDTFFTMLGLKQSGFYTLIQDIVNNFSYLINILGHIPNGNRGYYMSRSQPPYFAMMVELLAEIKGVDVLLKYQQAITKEYEFWMDGANNLTESKNATRRVVRMPDGTVLNRYWDDKNTPRPEAYKEDVKHAKESGRNPEEVYRNIRAAAESGWDFTGRWFADGKDMKTIRTTELVPVDLNALLYNVELVLARIAALQFNKVKEHFYREKAEARKTAVLKYCWCDGHKNYYDFDLINQKPTHFESLAPAYLLYFKMVNSTQATAIVEKLNNFVFPGGLVTTLTNTTQQWDAPNGWAPLQWITIRGLQKYGNSKLADTITKRWIDLNTKVYELTGKLVEKYNVESVDTPGGGGEYPTQDGFGWTNGVFLDLVRPSQTEQIEI